MVLGIVLIVAGVAMFFFIAVEGADSCGCLLCLIIPVGMVVAGIYLIVSDPFFSAKHGAVVGKYRSITLHEGQGLVVQRSKPPYRVDTDPSGTTIFVKSFESSPVLVSGDDVVVRVPGTPTYRRCAAAIDREVGHGGVGSFHAARGDNLCMQHATGPYPDTSILDLVHVTRVNTRLGTVTFDVTVWKSGLA